MGVSFTKPSSGIAETIQATGTLIDFSAPKVFNTASSPGAGNFTENLTAAKLGIIQKVYSQKATLPTFPATWKLIGEGYYVANQLNVVYIEFCGGTRVEFSIIQEQSVIAVA